MWPPLPPGARAGGIRGYPLNRVTREVAMLARHVHWTHQELMDLDHAERRRWLAAVLQLQQEAL